MSVRRQVCIKYIKYRNLYLSVIKEPPKDVVTDHLRSDSMDSPGCYHYFWSCLFSSVVFLFPHFLVCGSCSRLVLFVSGERGSTGVAAD